MLNLFDACLCVSKFNNHFCNPSITDSSDQSLIGLLGRSTFLVNHSLTLPLSHVPKNCTWVLVYLTPSRPCSLSYHSIPAINILYTSRSKLPEYSSEGLYSILSMQQLNHWGHLPNSLQMRCIPCALLDHDNHDPLLGILKQSLLPVIDTSWYLVQLLVPVRLFALAIPIHHLSIVFGIIFMLFYCPWCPRVLG